MAKKKLPTTEAQPPSTNQSQGKQPYSHRDGESIAAGVDGYKFANGYVIDDWLPELQGPRARQKYREMSDSPTAGALLAAVEMLLRSVEFRFKAAEADVDGFYVKFAESQINDLSDSFDNILTEILTFLPHGFSVMEMIFKYRDDGLITTAKIAPRSQETIWEWDIDEHGDVRGLWQWPLIGGAKIYIPAKQLLHFKTRMERGNPEGRSIFRSAYSSWYYEKNITNIEAIAIEREMNGIPVIKIPAAAFKDAAVLGKYQQMARDMKLNEQGGCVVPSTPYFDTEGNPTMMEQYKVELISSKGTRNIDTNTIIMRHKQDMLRTILADFLMLGANDRGSFALSKDKTTLFLRAVESFLDSITNELNKKWIGTLWELNGFDQDVRPELVRGEIIPVNLEELGKFIRDTGLLATMDNDTENFIREVAGMPLIEDRRGDVL